MSVSPPTNQPRKNLLRRTGRILVKVIASIFLLLILILILIQVPPVQNFARKKIEAFLEKKLNTRIDIGKIYIGLPRNIILSNVYLEDQQKDTLLSGGEIDVDITLMKLFRNEIEINEIHLEEVRVKVKRLLPDTIFNFQFIIDAFAPEKSKLVDTADSTDLNMAINSVILDNISLVYKDVITGNDMDVRLQHLDTRIDVFDPDKFIFDVPVVNVKGLRGRIYQSKPLVKPEPLAKDIAEAATPPVMQLMLKEIMINKVDLDYRNNVSAFYTTLNLNELKVHVNKLDLQNQVIDLKDLNLNRTNSAIRLGKKAEAKIVEKEVEQEVESIARSNWRFMVGTVRLNDNNFQFDNDNTPAQSSGIDYAHMKAQDLTLHVDDFLYSPDSVSGSIIKGKFREKSGFQLNALQTRFLYASNQTYLEDLLIKTPGTTIQHSAAIRYPSMEALKKNIGQLELDIDLADTRIQVKDILAFVPMLRGQPAFANPDNTWIVNSRIKGSVSNLQVDQLYFQGLQDTRVDVRGTIKGLPDMNRASANLSINNLSTTKNDITLFIPRGALPQNITLPQRMGLSGAITGNAGNLKTNLIINTTLGNTAITGDVQRITDAAKAQYNFGVKTNGLNLGAILQNPQLGTVTATFTARGKGFDPKTASANFNGVISSAYFNQYNYKNLKVKGTIANQLVNADAAIVDPNIHLAVNISANIEDEFPSLKVDATIDSIKTLPLNLTTESIVYRGKIYGDFPITDPDRLTGDLLITQSLLVREGQRMLLDTIIMKAGVSDSGRYLTLNSAPLNATIQGQYQLTQLGTIFQQAIQPYFAVMPNYTSIAVSAPYNFVVNASLVDHPLLKVFAPTLVRIKPIQIQSRFTSDTGWRASITAPLIVNGTQQIENLNLIAGTGQNAINVNATIGRIINGTSMNIYETSLAATVANNQINFDLINRDRGGKDKYHLAGLFQQPQHGRYSFSLKPDNLMLNYDAWTVKPDNNITITANDINVSNFVLSKNAQQLSINSTSYTTNSPIDVNFSNFQLATFTGFVKQDSLAINGTLNGNARLKNLMQQPVFTSDLTIQDLSLNRDTLGNVNMQVNNTVADRYAANITLTGRGNEVNITGNYFENGNLDLIADVRALQLNTIEGSTNGAISDASGTLSGKLSIKGTASKPAVNGDLNFNNTRFNAVMLGSYFSVDQEKIIVNEEGIRFNTFTLKDSAGNTAVIDGAAYTSDFVSYRFDMNINATDFRVLNTTKRDNSLFYGQLYFNSDLHVGGTPTEPTVDGSIKINEKTRFSVVLPQPEPGVVERDGIIEFIDIDSGGNDSLFMAPYDSLNKSTIFGFDIAANIEVDKEAEFNLIIDEGNGDFINVRGEAILTAGIDRSGNVTLTGSYELDQGSYELSFNFLKRKFNIQKGSRIVWTGTPTQADVDLTATYIANASPLDLVEKQLGPDAVKNYYRQKLPFEVYLKMRGQLLKPEITFDVVLPEDKNYTVSNEVLDLVKTKLIMLRQEPGELNKQVFALLLLNRFVAEDPFTNSNDAMTAGSFARQSVSKLLTEQLNRMAAGLIQGVELNFDVVSADDYTSGQRQNRTDLNVALSKRLLNDRLNVSVGSNFELEGPKNSNQQSNNIAGNIAVDYQLSKDGRYRLRAYRKNEYEGVIDGYIIETGVGFVITLDYDHFRDLFRRRKINEKKTTAPPPENTRPIKDTNQNINKNEE